MIEFEVIKSPDQNSIGKHAYYFNQVCINNKKDSHLIIDDLSMDKNSLFLKIKSNTLNIYTNNNFYFLSNNKKFSGTKVYKKDDVITFGSTNIKILKFSEEPEPKSIKEQTSSQIKKHSFLVPIFKAIQSELKKIISDNKQ